MIATFVGAEVFLDIFSSSFWNKYYLTGRINLTFL
jgi:hypothetical protein